jgi:hypothetical protein
MTRTVRELDRPATSRTVSLGSTLKIVLAVGAIAGLLRVLYGHGYVGYDGMYALLWGRDLVHGTTPNFDLPLAPTPHPLLTLLAAAISPLRNAQGVFNGLTFVAMAVALLAAFHLGRALFSVPVGLLFACILVSRQLLMVETLNSSQDIPFLALVLSAAALEATKRRRGIPVLLLLAAAGLLRPEAWLLSLAYLVYLVPAAARRERLLLAAIVASAPVLWVVFDLALTGDPLFSFHGTQALAAELERPRHVGTGLTEAPVYLKFILHNPVLLGGIAGCLAGLYALFDRSLLPAAILALGLIAFVVLAATGLPLLVRYLLLPAAMLALFFAVGAFGWLNMPQGAPGRLPWLVACALFMGALALAVPEDRQRLEQANRVVDAQQNAQADLIALANSPQGKLWMRRCPTPFHVPSHGVIPLLAFRLNENPTRFTAGASTPSSGLLFAPATPVVAATVRLDPEEASFTGLPPAGFDPAASNRSWILYVRCGGRL